MAENELTPAENRFRIWMYICAWMFAGAGLFFLFAGRRIAPFVNSASERFFPSLPLYQLPAGRHEGAFWLVLSLSMMAMITWICRAVYVDIRRNGMALVPILLLSKFCSSAFYLYFFITQKQLVHLVGTLTDGPIFLATLALWLPAMSGNRRLDSTDEDIIVAIGEAYMPPGGAFDIGYSDLRQGCIRDAHRMFDAQEPAHRLVSRIIFRIIDIIPVFFTFPPRTLRRLPLDKRISFIRRMEHHNFSVLRTTYFAGKFMSLLVFFSQEEAERAVGYIIEEPSQ